MFPALLKPLLLFVLVVPAMATPNSHPDMIQVFTTTDDPSACNDHPTGPCQSNQDCLTGLAVSLQHASSTGDPDACFSANKAMRPVNASARKWFAQVGGKSDPSCLHVCAKSQQLS